MNVLDTSLRKHDREIIDTERVSRPLVEYPEIDDTEDTIEGAFAQKDGEKVPPTLICTVCRNCLYVFCIFELDDFGVGVAETVVFDENCECFFIATL